MTNLYDHHKPFKGVDWSASLMRPGCQDHLNHPSRRGDALIPHKGELIPHKGELIHMGSKVQDFSNNARIGWHK